MVSDKKRSFSTSLERRARELIHTGQDSDAIPDSEILERIALTVEHLETLKTHEHSFLESILNSEVDVGTQILQLSPPGNQAYSLDARDKTVNKKLHERLRGKLMDLESEKRKLRERLLISERQLQGELLELLQEHNQLANQRFS